MPTKRRRIDRRPLLVTSDADVEYLLHGKGKPLAYFLPSHARSLWERQRDRLLVEWLRTRPGSRPFAWWRFDAPEPRRRVGGVGVPVFEALRFGVPVAWRIAGEYGALFRSFEPIDARDPPRYESEAAYLKRLGLLGDYELEVLRRADYRPEIVRV